MICTSCGQENRAGAAFCAWCGHALSAPANEQPQDPSPDETPTSRVLLEIKIAPDTPAQNAEIAVAHEHDSEPLGETVPHNLDVAPPAAALDGPPPEASREAGEMILHRYKVIEVLAVERDHVLYRAQDLTLCPNCGHTENGVDDAYCVKCGASLAEPPTVLVTEQMRHTPEAYDEHIVDGDRDYYLTREPAQDEPAPTDEIADPNAPLRLTWGCLTDKGITRDHNEDAIDVRVYTRSDGSKLGLFVVADGLGGQDAGEVASQMAMDAIWANISATIWLPILSGYDLEEQVLADAVRDAIAKANQTVYDERTAKNSDMSTTLTMALVVNDRVFVGNVGDSRTYLFDTEGLRPITKDHSLVQRLVDAGQLEPHEVYTHPRRNIVYQSIGDRPDIRIDLFQHQFEPEDRLILCSDGLWEMVRSEGIEEVLLSESDPQRACDRLVDNANLAGGEDNISVIVVQALG